MKYIILFFLFFAEMSISMANTEIDIYQGKRKLYNLAIPHFSIKNKKDVSKYHVQKIIQWDLASSNYINYISQANLFNQLALTAKPDFSTWNALNTDFLVLGSVKEDRNFNHRKILLVHIILWDIVRKKKLLDILYRLQPKNISDIHNLANDLYEKITGLKGYFNSKIIYVEHKQKKNYLKIMDQNGHNKKTIFYKNPLYVAPTFSSDGYTLLYLTQQPRRTTQMGILSLIGTPLTSFKKNLNIKPSRLTLSPKFINDETIVFSRISTYNGANLEIYKRNLRTHKEKRLTYSTAIDIFPTVSPDDQETMVFVSNKSGTPQLYRMNINDTMPVIKRLTFEGGKYFEPVWSHDGKKIAYVRLYKNQFSIEMMNPDGSDITVIIPPQINRITHPNFSPYDELILYSSKSFDNINKNILYRVSTHGGDPSQVSKDNISEGVWSRNYISRKAKVKE